MDGGLLNRTLIRSTLTHDAPWSGSHGATEDELGIGLLYYGFVHAIRARLAVCLGSGGGFVPRLMRQAQRDLGIADVARTILVDANKPEAGWGSPAWLPADSFFRTAYGDVEIVLSTTKEAAENLFARDRLTIDYLHIDADHSFSACLEDFHAYRPFLREGAIVTLHDTGFPGAGVCHVIEHLRTRDDVEVIDFKDIGAGTAVVRILGKDEAFVPKPASGRQYGRSGDPLVLTRRRDVPATEPPDMGWRYLESPAFASRNVLAAHHVRSCPMVVEIGSGKAGIDKYLTGQHEAVVIVDPLVRESRRNKLNGRSCAIWQIRARFQDLDWRIERPRKYGLVMLGIELQGMSGAEWQMLYDLVAQAAVTFIEFATSWDVSRQQFSSICSNAWVRESFTCKLDLNGNELGPMENSWPPRLEREIHVLEPA